MQKTVALWIGAVVVTAALSALLTWRVASTDTRRCVVDEGLATVGALIEDNNRIVESLKKNGYADSETAILESYLARVRKNGVQGSYAMKREIDALVNNNTAIVTLLSKYAAHARTVEP